VNIFSKILFWSVTILVGFVNPLFSVALVVVYYLPKIIYDLMQPSQQTTEYEKNSFSDDIAEEMK